MTNVIELVGRLAAPTSTSETELVPADDDNEVARGHPPFDPPRSADWMDDRIRGLVRHKVVPRTKETNSR
jgi:hypothetical protein